MNPLLLAFPLGRSRWLLSVCVLCLCLPAAARAQMPRIDPDGIDGSLLLCGSGTLAQPVLDHFFTLAGDAQARIVVLAGPEEKAQAITEHLTKEAEKRKARLDIVRLGNLKEKTSDLASSFAQATGVWLIGVAQTDEGLAQLHAECAKLLKRKGVIGAAGASAEMAAAYSQAHTHTLALLPDALIKAGGKSAPSPLLTIKSPCVEYDLEPGAALLAQGRTLTPLGEKKIVIRLKPSATLPARIMELDRQHPHDLTALRRSALDRFQDFPPKHVEPPVLEKGTLVIVGGGGVPDGLYQRFVALAGGAGKARIVIFPTANPDIPPKRDALAVAFRKAGAKQVTVLTGRKRAEVESKEFLDTLRAATGLWFDGGRQWRYVDCYEGTKALPLMFDVLKRGGVIGGTSAGATIQGDYLCRGGVFNNFDSRYEGYERGLGFLKGVAIDQHFSKRKRLADMTALMKIHPQYLGIGVDETTAIIVQGSVAEVVGRGKAFFYDARRKTEKGQPDYVALPAGGRYDLVARKVLTKTVKD